MYVITKYTSQLSWIKAIPCHAQQSFNLSAVECSPVRTSSHTLLYVYAELTRADCDCIASGHSDAVSHESKLYA